MAAEFPRVAAATEIDAKESPRRQATWGWHDVIEQRLQAVPVTVMPPKGSAAKNPDLSPLLLHAAPDTDVITLSPFRVNGSRMEEELRQRFARADRAAKEEAVLRRTGTGVHVKRIGGWDAGVMTVFGVPVMVAISKAW